MTAIYLLIAGAIGIACQLFAAYLCGPVSVWFRDGDVGRTPYDCRMVVLYLVGFGAVCLSYSILCYTGSG